jgi:Secretory lipase
VTRSPSRSGLVLAAALAVGAIACSHEPTSEQGTEAEPTTASTITDDTPALPAGIDEGPAGESFFVPPEPLPPGEPGTVIWARPFAAFEDADGFRVLFRSLDDAGDTVAVSGLVLLPSEPPPHGSRPLAVSASSRGSVADACTASNDPTYERGNVEVGQWSERANAQALLREGYAVVVPDYQGFGTPGPSPYLAGPSAGRNVLDALRALRTFVGPTAGDAVAIGDTQGGSAVLFAAELASTYAPDTRLAGVVATQPLAELATLAPAASASPAFGYVLLAITGLSVADTDLDPSDLLTRDGLRAAAQYETTCGEQVTDALSREDPATYLRDPGSVPEAALSVFEANSPGNVATDVPILVVHGRDAALPPLIISQLLLDRYCRLGTANAELAVYDGADNGAVAAALDDTLAWISDRLAGRRPTPTPCT